MDTQSLFLKRKRKHNESLHKLKPDTLLDIKKNLLASKSRQKIDKLDKELEEKKSMILVKQRINQKDVNTNSVENLKGERNCDVVTDNKTCTAETKPDSSSLSLLSSNYQSSSDSESSDVK